MPDLESFEDSTLVAGDLFVVRRFSHINGVLTGVSMTQPVFPGINDAQCQIGGLHKAPIESCTCGWYALYGGDLWEPDFSKIKNTTIAVVKLSGKIVLSERGYRSEKMELVARTKSNNEKKTDSFKDNLNKKDWDSVYGIPVYSNKSLMLRKHKIEKTKITKQAQKTIQDIWLEISIFIGGIFGTFGEFSLRGQKNEVLELFMTNLGGVGISVALASILHKKSSPRIKWAIIIIVTILLSITLHDTSYWIVGVLFMLGVGINDSMIMELELHFDDSMMTVKTTRKNLEKVQDLNAKLLNASKVNSTLVNFEYYLVSEIMSEGKANFEDFKSYRIKGEK